MSVEAEVSSQARVGRPRSAQTDQAIRDATLDLLVEVGFGGMSMEAVAARAGVGKAAIYRRWSSKEQMVVESLRGHAVMEVPLVDSGDLRADLLVLLEGLRRSLSGEDGPILTAFVSEKTRYPELRAEFERVFVARRRAHVRRIVTAAVDRGELPPHTDVELLSDAGPALLLHRSVVNGQPLDPDLPRRILDLLLDSPASHPG